MNLPPEIDDIVRATARPHDPFTGQIVGKVVDVLEWPDEPTLVLISAHGCEYSVTLDQLEEIDTSHRRKQ